MMETLVVILLGVIAGLVLLCLFLVSWLYTMRTVNEALVERGYRHRDCMDRVVWHLGNEFAALVLTHAADRWDTIEGVKERERLRREYQPEDGGVAVQWMREQARRWKERDQ